jgi:hypothetical protein
VVVVVVVVVEVVVTVGQCNRVTNESRRFHFRHSWGFSVDGKFATHRLYSVAIVVFKLVSNKGIHSEFA